MNYERIEGVIKLLNGVLAAYMWTYLIPITPSTPKRHRNRLTYTLLIMTGLLLIDWSTRALAVRLQGVVSETVLSYLPVMSGILAYLIVLPPLSLLITGQKARRCFGIGALVLLVLYLADFLLLLFFWTLWFPDRQLELSTALLPSDSRVVMLMAVQSIMYLLLLALHLASRPKKRRRVWYLLLFPLWGVVVSNLLLYFLIHQCGRSVTTTVLLCTVTSNLLLVICTDQLLSSTSHTTSCPFAIPGPCKFGPWRRTMKPSIRHKCRSWKKSVQTFVRPYAKPFPRMAPPPPVRLRHCFRELLRFPGSPIAATPWSTACSP